MRDWLKIYLPNIRFRSQNTIDSYESSLNLYLDFLEKNKQSQSKILKIQLATKQRTLKISLVLKKNKI